MNIHLDEIKDIILSIGTRILPVLKVLLPPTILLMLWRAYMYPNLWPISFRIKDVTIQTVAEGIIFTVMLTIKKNIDEDIDNVTAFIDGQYLKLLEWRAPTKGKWQTQHATFGYARQADYKGKSFKVIIRHLGRFSRRIEKQYTLKGQSSWVHPSNPIKGQSDSDNSELNR